MAQKKERPSSRFPSRNRLELRRQVGKRWCGGSGLVVISSKMITDEVPNRRASITARWLRASLYRLPRPNCAASIPLRPGDFDIALTNRLDGRTYVHRQDGACVRVYAVPQGPPRIRLFTLARLPELSAAPGGVPKERSRFSRLAKCPSAPRRGRETSF